MESLEGGVMCAVNEAIGKKEPGAVPGNRDAANREVLHSPSKKERPRSEHLFPPCQSEWWGIAQTPLASQAARKGVSSGTASLC